MLRGARLCSVGRAADMGVLALAGAGGEEVALHVQCPFRVVHGDRVMLGSGDLRYVRDGAADEGAAFDAFGTRYDDRAADLNRVLGGAGPVVGNVVLGPGGSLTLEAGRGLRVEIVPDRSGRDECWRAFVRGGPHYGCPPGVV
ncbi:hypothetical protein [Streptomyces griseosporeus]|uniref:hypothetical protein n=1 Tax=Streptomyces griseosporeus TaxID=1910 RepID=UPI0036FD896F